MAADLLCQAFALLLSSGQYSLYVDATILSFEYAKIGVDGEVLADGALIAEEVLSITAGGNGAVLRHRWTTTSCAGLCSTIPDCNAYSLSEQQVAGNVSCRVGRNRTDRQLSASPGSRVFYKIMPLKIKSGQHCAKDMECSAWPLMRCVASSCICVDGYIPSANLSNCLPTNVLLGQPCEQSAQCLHSSTENVTCSAASKTCSCDIYTSVASTANNACLPIVTYGDACLEPQQCPRNCTNGRCSCANEAQEDLPLVPGPNCVIKNMTQLDASHGMPLNLSYPDPRTTYNPFLDNWWCVQTAKGTYVNVTVTFWDVEEWYDYVSVYEDCGVDTQLIHKFRVDSGLWMESETTKTTRGNHVAIRFTSDYSRERTGFTLTFNGE